MDKLAALVPMKGHSERVPGKNLRLLHGKPLFYYVIKALYDSGRVETVIINTDDEQIADTATREFPEIVIHRRPDHITGDFVSMNDIIAYDIEQAAQYTHWIQTHSTNPLVSAQTFGRAIDEYFSHLQDFDSLFSVTRHQSRFYDKDFRAVNHNPGELLRTQDLPPLYEENSCFYVFNTASFAAAGNKRIGNHPGLFEVNKLEAVDIDEPEDFRMAEILMASIKDRQS